MILVTLEQVSNMTIFTHAVVSSLSLCLIFPVSEVVIESSSLLLSMVVFDLDDVVSFLCAVHLVWLLKSPFFVSSSSLVCALPFPGVPKVVVVTTNVIFMVCGC